MRSIGWASASLPCADAARKCSNSSRRLRQPPACRTHLRFQADDLRQPQCAQSAGHPLHYPAPTRRESARTARAGSGSRLPVELIFDSKLTTYANLNALNRLGIRFITLRRRGEKVLEQLAQAPASACLSNSSSIPS